MNKNEIEVWKPHPDIDVIEVSTLGRVRTLDRMVSGKGNGTRFQKGQVLKQFVSVNGYMRVSIRIDGKPTKKLVHRLVAQTFLPNPDNLPMVNHRDCNRKNNNVENLEFCDNSYNQKYRNRFGISVTESIGKPLFAVNLSTLEVSHFRSQSEAGRVLGFSQGHIGAVIRGKRNHAGDFWFVNDDDNADDIIKRKLHALQSQLLGL